MTPDEEVNGYRPSATAGCVCFASIHRSGLKRFPALLLRYTYNQLPGIESICIYDTVYSDCMPFIDID